MIADFSEAEFVDLAILRVLRRANRVAAQRGTRFSLQLGTASIVERLFEVSRLKEELRCFPDEGGSAVRGVRLALAASRRRPRFVAGSAADACSGRQDHNLLIDVLVVTTRTRDGEPPPNYDPSEFPAFAVTVDVVILTMSEGLLHVLLVCRGEAPFEGMWAIPGGFKRPTETLDEAARRELREETGVDAASTLTQFGAYGDPERDPRMNVVTVAYLAVLRDIGTVVGGSDAAAAALIPVSDVLNGKVELAFDHLRIVRDAVERIRIELELSGIATAFVGTTFTLAELRAVYEAIWGVQLDAANFRRSVVADDGWVIPTGRTARPGPGGGRPAELYRAGRAWKHGAPIHRLQPRRKDVT